VRIYVAGASGVIGRRLLPLLTEAGHEGAAMTRSRAQLEQDSNLGPLGIKSAALDFGRREIDVTPPASRPLRNEKALP
jgi:nucleoside-diphosphate-sugar epimerase